MLVLHFEVNFFTPKLLVELNFVDYYQILGVDTFNLCQVQKEKRYLEFLGPATLWPSVDVPVNTLSRRPSASDKY